MLSANVLNNHGFSGIKQGAANYSGNLSSNAHGVKSSAVSVTLANAYEKMRTTLSSNLPPATTESSSVTAPSYNNDDFSPDAVTDRIMGFIQQRLDSEKANGASDERLQMLYQQALSGVEKGLKEAKSIIQGQGMFDGEVKTNFDTTVSQLADSLQALGESLFGEKNLTSAPDIEASRTQVAASRSRSFEMEVVTQDGDKVKLVVNSGQQLSAKSYNVDGENASVSGFSSSFAAYDNVSFQVKGDLDEAEVAALKDLFSQVNSVAETFYAGDVEQAFNQAMDVGMDTQELAAFAVNMNKTETVAVRNTYVAIDDMGKSKTSRSNTSMFESLGKFAHQLKDAQDKTASIDHSSFNMKSLLESMVSRLHSEHGEKQGNGDRFNDFVRHMS